MLIFQIFLVAMTSIQPPHLPSLRIQSQYSTQLQAVPLSSVPSHHSLYLVPCFRYWAMMKPRTWAASICFLLSAQLRPIQRV